jgi:hypothetical protein
MTNKSKAAAVRINSATSLISLRRESINFGVYHTRTGCPLHVRAPHQLGRKLRQLRVYAGTLLKNNKGNDRLAYACRSFPSVELLELEPHLERALARRLERTSANVVDEPESAR